MFMHQQIFVCSVVCFMYVLFHMHVTSPLLINAAYCITYQRHLLGLVCDAGDASPIHPCGDAPFQKSACG